MATSYKDCKDFRDAMFNEYVLDECIQWIGVHLSPEDVFDDEVLSGWAKDKGFVKSDE